jgi:hypothetical protein
LAEVTVLSQTIGKRLMTWSIGSISIGIILILSVPSTLLAGIGLQAIIWGGIDAAISYYILRIQKEHSVEKIINTVHKNIYLDIVYQVVGVIVIIVYMNNPYLMGNGVGVVIQGFFLLLLDFYYHRELRNLL